MKISLSWLRQYVAFDEADDVTRRLTFAGLEVEGATRPGQALAGVVVARIVDSRQHPNADKLSVTRVDAGTGAALQVVCGAKNYQVGDLVPLATPGAVMADGRAIGRTTMRGVESEGMLCSARELGLSANAEGLLILPAALVPGTPLARALELDDTVLELNVTPNRADALSHLGVARDVAALLGRTVEPPSVALREEGTPAARLVKVTVEDTSRCWRYAARVVEGLTVGPSPAWLQRRLESCGVRAINNLVDVTNFVLLEYGQPLHAFDLDTVAGAQVVVRTARPGETLRTLDDKERTLHPEDLLICDARGPAVLAGVMGGAGSEVKASTTRVLLECATFAPATVRRSARRHGLHTESSHRFERGTDVEAVPLALDRAAALLAELGGGTVRPGRVDVYPRPHVPREVTLRGDKLAQVLGTPVPLAEAARILQALGFGVREATPSALAVQVPAARVDVSLEEDLIEEVARIRGYELIPQALPRGLSSLRPPTLAGQVEVRLRAALQGQGVDEVVNYSFVSPQELEAVGALAEAVPLANPLSVEQSVLRTTLLPSLVANVVRASRHQVEGVRLYELARSYRARRPLPAEKEVPVADERREVAGVLWGLREGVRSWTSGAAAADFYDAKGLVEALVGAVSRQAPSFAALVDSPWYHPRAAATVTVGEVRLGTVGELHPRAARALQAPGGVYLFQLELAGLEAVAGLVPQAAGLPRFPAVLRDVAFVVDSAVPAAAVRAVVLEVGAPLVEDAHVFDVYEGPQVGPGKKNVALALRYRSSERTLQDAEVAEAHARVEGQVRERLGGALRGG